MLVCLFFYNKINNEIIIIQLNVNNFHNLIVYHFYLFCR